MEPFQKRWVQCKGKIVHTQRQIDNCRAIEKLTIVEGPYEEVWVNHINEMSMVFKTKTFCCRILMLKYCELKVFSSLQTSIILYVYNNLIVEVELRAGTRVEGAGWNRNAMVVHPARLTQFQKFKYFYKMVFLLGAAWNGTPLVHVSNQGILQINWILELLSISVFFKPPFIRFSFFPKKCYIIVVSSYR